eukprot:108160-Pleurochrysis_carterae.AAC.7
MDCAGARSRDYERIKSSKHNIALLSVRKRVTNTFCPAASLNACACALYLLLWLLQACEWACMYECARKCACARIA